MVSVSIQNYNQMASKYRNLMCCVPKYPADIKDYEKFSKEDLKYAISDHTVGWELFKKYKPAIIEKHFVHERDPENPDAGMFAVTAEELKEIL